MKTTNKKCNCQECQNEINLENSTLQVNDVVECPACGIEYIVVNLVNEGDKTEYLIEEFVEKK